MTPGKFNMLRKKLQNDTDLNAIMNYFYDHFADHEEFIKMCEPTRHEDLESLLPTVIRGVFKRPRVVLRDVVLLRVPGQNMVHGGFSIDGALGFFFYFEDLDMGAIGIVGGPLGDLSVAVRFRISALITKNGSS